MELITVKGSVVVGILRLSGDVQLRACTSTKPAAHGRLAGEREARGEQGLAHCCIILSVQLSLLRLFRGSWGWGHCLGLAQLALP